MVRARVFATGCGYPDADDLDTLRRDPAFKLACGRLPESGADLTSQPTLSRLENAPDLRALLRASRLRGKLARGGVVPRPVAGLAAASNLNAGAAAPIDPQPAQPPTPDRSGSTRRAASQCQLQPV